MGGGSGLALTIKTDGFRTMRRSSAESADCDLAEGVAARFDCKTYGLRTIGNSPADSVDGDLGWGHGLR